MGASEVEELSGNVSVLKPTQFLEKIRNGDVGSATVALIILNSPITDFFCFNRIYSHASFRLCADGGANRLHDTMMQQYPDLPWDQCLKQAIPDVIHGDLDSLNDEIARRYRELGVKISKDDDQYSTDFGKGVNKVLSDVSSVNNILIWGSLGGRVDQGIGLLHELYREQKFRHPGIRFWLFSETSVSVLLAAGTTVIHTPLKAGLIGHHIGILPLYGPAVITTNGLEWDVEAWDTEMGGQVSTSNHIVGEQVTITTDRTVLFTIARNTGS